MKVDMKERQRQARGEVRSSSDHSDDGGERSGVLLPDLLNALRNLNVGVGPRYQVLL